MTKTTCGQRRRASKKKVWRETMTPEQLQVWRWRMDAATMPPFRVLLRVRYKVGAREIAVVLHSNQIHAVAVSRGHSFRTASIRIRKEFGYPEPRV